MSFFVALGGEDNGENDDKKVNKLYNEGYQTGYMDAEAGIPPRFVGEVLENGMKHFHSDFAMGYNQGYINYQTSNPSSYEVAQEAFLRRCKYFDKGRQDTDN